MRSHVAESWIDRHVDVLRHPFTIGGSNRFRRWGLTRAHHARFRSLRGLA